MPLYRYPTELLFARDCKEGFFEIEASSDDDALAIGRKRGAVLEMNNMQVRFHGRWRNVSRLRAWIAETQHLIDTSDA